MAKVLSDAAAVDSRSLSFADLAGYMLEAAGNPTLAKTAPIVQPA